MMRKVSAHVTGGLLLCGLGATLWGCAPEGSHLGAEALSSPQPASVETVPAVGVAEHLSDGMSPGLRLAWLRARMAEAGDEHRVVAEGAALAARVPEMGLTARFEQATRIAHSDAEVRLALSSLGRVGGPDAALPRARAEARDDHAVDYRRGAVTEHWRSGPLGLELGATLAERPRGGAGEVELSLSVSGATARGEGARVTIERPGSRGALVVSELFVEDAEGRLLPSRMQGRGERLAILFDDHGARYPVVVDPLVATEEQKLTASDGVADDQLGAHVALSGDGTTALVGAPRRAISGAVDQGRVLVFTRSGTMWDLQATLEASDGAALNRFGIAAISGDGGIALVGASHNSVGGNADQGAAYVFVRSGTAWSEEQKLTSSDGVAGDLFGDDVALSSDGTRAIVGARGADVDGTLGQGAAYVFRRSGTSWTEEGKLTASDGAAGVGLGTSVALTADGSRALAGAVSWPAAMSFRGAAYVFLRSGTTWTEEAILTASDGADEDWFGRELDISDDGGRALVAADRHDVGTNLDQGSVYVFLRTGTAWAEEEQLIVSDGAALDRFGFDVALSGNGSRAIVGAVDAVIGGEVEQGRVQVFDRTGTTWGEEAAITASDGRAGALFGSAVALSMDGITALVGARGDLDASEGSAYVLTLRLTNGDACTSADACLSGFCVDMVCCSVPCDDSDPCTADSCGEAGDCVNEPIAGCATTDGGPTPGDGGGSGADGGSVPKPHPGCGCRAVGRRARAGEGAWMLLMLLCPLLLRRRSRRAREDGAR